MHWQSILLTTSVCFSLSNFVKGSNILVLLPLPSRSHFISFQPLIQETILKGHNLTLVSGHRLSDDFETKYAHVDIKRAFSSLSKYYY